MSVLVVDDQPLNRLLLGKMLRSLGLNVIEAGDGHAGLQAYLQALQYGKAVGMVFMDIMMPVCNGIQAVMSIRSAENRHGWMPVPIVAYTSEDVAQGSPLWQQCMQSGFNDVVGKPVNKLFATQLLCRWMPGLATRCTRALGNNHATSGGRTSGSEGSSDEEVLCGCGQAAASSCGSCSKCGGGSSRSRSAFGGGAFAAQATSSAFNGGGGQPSGSVSGSDASQERDSTACSPETAPTSRPQHI